MASLLIFIAVVFPFQLLALALLFVAYRRFVAGRREASYLDNILARQRRHERAMLSPRPRSRVRL
jgi:hypothetical protein